MDEYSNIDNQDYSNREVDSMFKIIDTKLDSLIIQTTKTNGRVNKHDDEIINLKSWQSYSKGAVAVLAMLLVPILIYQANQWLLK